MNEIQTKASSRVIGEVKFADLRWAYKELRWMEEKKIPLDRYVRLNYLRISAQKSAKLRIFRSLQKENE